MYPMKQPGCALRIVRARTFNLGMEIRVLFFGMLKDLVGSSAESLTLPAGSVLADVLGTPEDYGGVAVWRVPPPPT